MSLKTQIDSLAVRIASELKLKSSKAHTHDDSTITSVDWSKITNKPGSLSSTVDWSIITSKPTTLSGFGIADVVLHERSGGDVNTWTTPGFYGLSNSETNAPAIWTAGFVSRSADCVTQLFPDSIYGVMKYRVGNPLATNGQWAEWRYMLDSYNFRVIRNKFDWHECYRNMAD